MKFALSALAKRGFTLIELLVVIAIIGILSSVVLASLNTARSKGTDAKIQAEIRSIAVNAEIFYDNNGNSYGTASSNSCTTAGSVFASTNPNVAQIIADLTAASTAVGADPICNSTASAWAVKHVLTASTTGGGFCMDSTGNVKMNAVAQGTFTVCQ